LSDDSPRHEVANFLAARNSPHLRAEFFDPALEFHLSFDHELATELGYRVEGATEIRLKDESSPGLSGPLRCASIATNGRNPSTGRVSFIGIDIDSDVGHNRGLDDTAIERIIEKLKLVPWLQINHSRGGKGIHLYAFFARDIFAVDNSAMYPLGRGLVERIAEEIEEPDLSDLVDKAGSMMFIWAPGDKPNKFALIQPAKHLFLEELEPYYPAPIRSEIDDVRELDDEQKQLVEWLEGNAKKDFARDGVFFHTHTSDLEAAHAALNLRGKFTTTATGRHESKFNCFMRPIPNGAWLVGCWGDSEKDWIASERGYRYTLLNPMTTLKDFADENEIVDTKGSYGLTVQECQNFCAALGKEFPLPGPELTFVAVTQKPDHIRFDIDINPNSVITSKWRRASSRKAFYLIGATQSQRSRNLTDIVRVAYSEGGKGLSYFRKLHNRYWLTTSIEDVQTKLMTFGLDASSIAKFITTDTPFEIVNEPFRGEMLSKFKWNRGAVQLAYKVGEAGPYPHRQMILDHCGSGLNAAVANDDWCVRNNIRTGADYLMLWQARLFRAPLERLPALSFISSDQNCGKSTFFWSTGALMTRGGYVLASKALTSNFESQLMGAVLCDLDDVDLSQRDGAIYQKMQSLLTNSEMSIEGKGANPIQVRNSTHWGHSANKADNCPIVNGDTRFVVVEVSPLEHEIPAPDFERALSREAPAYLHALFNLQMPEAAGRLYLPVLNTPIKLRLMARRATEQLTDEQARWLKRIERLANDGKLAELTPFPELKALLELPEDATARAITGIWPKFASILEGNGYEVGDRQNSGGNSPAAWYVRKRAK
jgi:hypothetical protein